MFEIYDGDLFLFDCYTQDEADELYEQGFKIKRIFNK